MKLLVTTHWVQSYLKDWEKDFPDVEFVGGSTPEEIKAAAADAEVAFGPVNEELFHAAKKVRGEQLFAASLR